MRVCINISVGRRIERYAGTHTHTYIWTEKLTPVHRHKPTQVRSILVAQAK